MLNLTLASRLRLTSLFIATLSACGGGSTNDVATVKLAPTDTFAVVDPVTAAAKNFTGNGIYWDPNQSGTGIFVEAQGNTAVVSFFMYEDGTGKATWYLAAGAFVANADGTYSFTGQLQNFRGGQAITSPTVQTPAGTVVSNVSVLFNGKNATVTLPARTINTTRFEFGGTNGLNNPGTATQPETGIYWSPAQGGRGFTVEVQNNIAVVTMYHYNADGSPTWNVMTGSIQTGTALAAFNGFTGGQSLTSAYRVPSAGTSVGNLRVQFNGPCEGQIQLDNLPIINVQRFAFGDLPVGQECRARTVVPAPAPTPVPAPVPVPVPVPAPAPTPAPASSAVKGKALYATYCAVCHGPSPVNNIDKVLRGANAPSIILNAINSNAGGMGILKGAISTQDASDLAAYLATPRI